MNPENIQLLLQSGRGCEQLALHLIKVSSFTFNPSSPCKDEYLYWHLLTLRPSCLPPDHGWTWTHSTIPRSWPHAFVTGFREMPKSAHKAWISIRRNLISDPLWERSDLFLTVSAAIKPQLCITGWKIRSFVPEQIQLFVHHELNHRYPN